MYHGRWRHCPVRPLRKRPERLGDCVCTEAMAWHTQGVLYWTDETNVSVQLEDTDLGGPRVFPHGVGVSAHFATIAFAWAVKLFDHIALVLKALAVEIRHPFDSPEAYLVVQGVGIEGAPTGALRF